MFAVQLVDIALVVHDVADTDSGLTHGQDMCVE
jgi:hypothetical protein